MDLATTAGYGPTHEARRRHPGTLLRARTTLARRSRARPRRARSHERFALVPGHCLQLIDAVLAQVEDVKQRLNITDKSAEPATDATHQPSHVLATMIRVNRELSRSLETPFTPADVYRTVALASAYATRL